MPAKRRTRIGECIYRDAFGIAIAVKVGDAQREQRYPPGTDLEFLKAEVEKLRVKVRGTQVGGGRRGTLEGDAPRYLRQVAHLVSLKARRVEVNAWVKQLGPRLRGTITAEDVRRVRSTWLKGGTSPKTVNNRVQTLRHLYVTLDGDDESTPCDKVKPLPVHKTPAVYVDAAVIVAVEKKLAEKERIKDLPDAKTRARFRVYASTGKRPSEIMRATRRDVDLERRVWIARDGKGGTSPGLYLTADMVEAWRLFIAADAWGKFNTNSFARTLRESGWPAGVKPYNLRHTTWLTASERGADLGDIQAGAGHRSAATTRRHYVPVLNSRMQRLSELTDRAFGWGADPPAATPAKVVALRRHRRAGGGGSRDGG